MDVLTVTDELREACAEVARRARSVRVQEAAIAPYAVALDLRGGPGADPSDAAAASPGEGGADAGAPDDAAAFEHASRADRAAYWLTLDAINFGSGWFPTLRKPEGRSGYGTIAAAWRRRFERCGPFAADELVALQPARVAAILGQDPDHELMELFSLSLRDLGEWLLTDFGGAPLALVDEARGSAVRFADALGGRACFADRSRYEELSIPFLKRAQIAAADLARAGAVRWTDTAGLTMFANNLVPHVLRLDGVLAFEPGLVARIEAGRLIEHGSPEEVEIRACALQAVELIVAARGGSDTASAVDQLLWQRGQSPRYKAAPRHRSRTTAY